MHSVHPVPKPTCPMNTQTHIPHARRYTVIHTYTRPTQWSSPTHLCSLHHAARCKVCMFFVRFATQSCVTTHQNISLCWYLVVLFSRQQGVPLWYLLQKNRPYVQKANRTENTVFSEQWTSHSQKKALSENTVCVYFNSFFKNLFGV